MTQSSIHQRVHKKIHEQKVQPLPAWRFWLRNDVFWALWVLSIGIGAMAFSLVLSLSLEDELDVYLSMPFSWSLMFVLSLPVVAVMLYGLVSGLAAYNLQRTKHGYRFRFSRILFSGFVVSLILGCALHFSGWSDSFDLLLSQNVPPYRQIREQRMDMWSQPGEGMIAGTVESVQGDLLLLEDLDGFVWTVDIKDAAVPPRPLEPGLPIRVLGIMGEEGEFFASEIRPWRPRRILEY